jgi:hypothetical protein
VVVVGGAELVILGKELAWEAPLRAEEEEVLLELKTEVAEAEREVRR